MRLRLNINNDNRFSYYAPIVTNVNPHQGISNGGQQIQITGQNFGIQTSNIKEILVKGIPCHSFTLVNPTLITCIIGENPVIGVFNNIQNTGNVIVKLTNGLTSPIRTCKMFEYTPRIMLFQVPIEVKVLKPPQLMIGKVQKKVAMEEMSKRRPKLLGEPVC